MIGTAKSVRKVEMLLTKVKILYFNAVRTTTASSVCWLINLHENIFEQKIGTKKRNFWC